MYIYIYVYIYLFLYFLYLYMLHLFIYLLYLFLGTTDITRYKLGDGAQQTNRFSDAVFSNFGGNPLGK